MAAFLRYGVVGGSALVLHLMVLQGLLWTHTCAAWVASAAGFALACVFSYTLQHIWVFRSDRSHAVALPRYLATTVVMMGVNVSVFATLTASGLLPVVAQTLTTGCMFILNFYGSRRFTFAGAAAKP